ncbi:MAG TPA: hypothetical protein VFZ17_00150 [Acidimicrobiia bacterium]|nr:hypothetical protein [Acidimicrobiia bacterium]
MPDPVVDDAPGAAASSTAPSTSWRLQVRDGSVVAIASAAITALLMRVWAIPLRAPFLYQRDGIAQIAEVKASIENGWYQFNPRLGWPGGADHHDFPIGTDNLHWVLLKVIGFFTGDAVLAINLYYLLSFVLVALVAFFVTRSLGVSRIAAFVAALLYTFLPYHFLRGTWHLPLAAYFTVPIACLFTIRVWEAAPPFFGPTADGAPRFEWKTRRTLWFVLGALAISVTGLYYAAFCIALLAIVGVLRLVVAREWRPIASAVALTVVMGAGIFANTLPSFLYWSEHGPNDAVAQRSVAESDYYALRPIQMVSPIPGYRIGAIGEITNRVFTAPSNSEATQFLGLIGSLGLLGLFAVLLGLGSSGRPDTRAPPLLLRLGALAVISIVLGVTGGFSWIFGMAGLAEIRAWNRISVFIGFYALVAVAIWLDRFRGWLPDFRHKALVVPAAALLLVGIGVFDQTSNAIIPDSRRMEAEWDRDARFVQRIEAAMPSGTAVFQLPYLPYPEAEDSVPPFGMVDYDPLRGYVHSDDLSWSYGGTRGRESDWQAQVVKLPTADMLDAITAVGFRGLWVDRFGYPERAAAIEGELASASGAAPIESEDGRFAFYDLRDHAAQVKARLGASGVRALRDKVLHDVG